MGEVYRAVDLELEIPVPLKTIRRGIASDPLSLRALEREVLMARSISHPNVCRIYDLGRDEESPDAEGLVGSIGLHAESSVLSSIETPRAEIATATRGR